MMNMMNPMTMQRIVNEYQYVTKDKDLIQIGCSFSYNPNNIFIWYVTMLGPDETPYEGGLFRIRIEFPFDYPNHGPEFIFENKIYHLNVNFTDSSPDKKGHVCLSSLNEWRTTGRVSGKPNYGVKQALMDIFCLFFNPGIDSPYSQEMANLYKTNVNEFNRIASEWTKEYASLSN